MSDTSVRRRFAIYRDPEAGGLYTEVYKFTLSQDVEYKTVKEIFEYAGYKTTELFVNNQLAFEISLNRIEV